MGKSKKNRNKDKRDSSAYYEERYTPHKDVKKAKNRNIYKTKGDKVFTDWDSL
jgi:hypothetical protein